MGNQKRKWRKKYDKGGVNGREGTRPRVNTPYYRQFVPTPNVQTPSFQERLRRDMSTDDYNCGNGISLDLLKKLKDNAFIPVGKITDLNVEIGYVKPGNFSVETHVGRNFEIDLSPHHRERYLVTLRDYISGRGVLITNTNNNIVEGAVNIQHLDYYSSGCEIPYTLEILRRFFNVRPIELYRPSSNYGKLKRPIRNF
jgi:hypothetical protein